MKYQKLFNLFDRKAINIDETSFYFRDDPCKTEHFIGYTPQYESPYWVGYCDIECGCDFKTAKELAKLLSKNYYSIMIPQLRISMIFDILYTDLVIDKNIASFKRHFKWIGEREKKLCTKFTTDVSCYYNIYNVVKIT